MDSNTDLIKALELAEQALDAFNRDWFAQVTSEMWQQEKVDTGTVEE